MRNELYSSHEMAPILCLSHVGVLPREVIPPYDQQASHKDEEASQAGSQILPAYYKLVAHPVGRTTFRVIYHEGKTCSRFRSITTRRRCARQSSGAEAHENHWVGSSPNRSRHPLVPRRLASCSTDVR